MKSFSEYNPSVTALWFLSVALFSMFCKRPETALISYLSAISFFTVKNRGESIKTHVFFAVFIAVLSLANPIFNHRGETVLFVANDNPITLEALIYGINSAFSIAGTLCWFRCFSQIMTSDRLMHITGRLSPKLSLVFSMCVRFLPLMKRQSEKIKDTQKTLGIYGDGTFAEKVAGNMRVFSSLATWSLENSIVTADSMTARGYGISRRTHYTDFSMTLSDRLLLAVTVLLSALCTASAVNKGFEVQFYPSFSTGRYGFFTVLGNASFAVLSFIPLIAEIWSEIKWKLLLSEI